VTLPHGTGRPFTVDAQEYPFEDHWFDYRDGTIHYVDVGTGPTVLLLHGNPTWSYLYRNVIRQLSNDCRLVAPDLPGFGMSRAPSDYCFTPVEHAAAVLALADHLGLTDIVLVVQDWGGPIGMSFATDVPGRLRGLVIMNTFAWPASFMQRVFSLVMGGRPLGYWLQTRRNYFAKAMLPDGIHNKAVVTEALREAYVAPFPTPPSRVPTWIFPRQIRKARPWLAQLESRLVRISHLPAQIVWGEDDVPGFPASEMQKWEHHLPNHETETLADAGHSVPEDRPDRVAAAIVRVIERSRSNS
jgi:haloalkane dehalogenase